MYLWDFMHDVYVLVAPSLRQVRSVDIQDILWWLMLKLWNRPSCRGAILATQIPEEQLTHVSTLTCEKRMHPKMEVELRDAFRGFAQMLALVTWSARVRNAADSSGEQWTRAQNGTWR